MNFAPFGYEKDHHAGFNGVKTSENGIFLYKSNHAASVVWSRASDYMFFGCLGGLVTGLSQFLLLPLVVFSCEIPRKWAVMKYFTYHAELLPHTEQVVFHKVSFFGV